MRFHAQQGKRKAPQQRAGQVPEGTRASNLRGERAWIAGPRCPNWDRIDATLVIKADVASMQHSGRLVVGDVLHN